MLCHALLTGSLRRRARALVRLEGSEMKRAKAWFGKWVASGKRGAFLNPDQLDIPDEDKALMDELDTAMEAFLLAACELGQVSHGLGDLLTAVAAQVCQQPSGCVTLARRPWQDRTMQAFLPKLRESKISSHV